MTGLLTPTTTGMIDSLPSTSVSIFKLKKMVFADKEIHGSFVGQPTQPQIRIGAYEVRLFVYENKSPQYQLILTNFNGKLIWFSDKERGWYTLTEITSQRDFIDELLIYPGVTECIEDIICLQQVISTPIPQGYIGSVTSSRISERHYGKAYCGDALRRKVDKWK